MNEKIRSAYNSIRPTDEQKNRMLRNIVTQMPAVNSRKYRSYPTEPKRRSVFFSVLALLLAVCVSTLYLLAKQPEDNPQQNQEGPETTETQRNDYEEHLVQIELDFEEKKLTYELIQRYRSLVLKLISLDKEPAFEYYEEYEISCLTGYVSDIEEIGYLVTDLDENGTPEVIISDGTVIYDLYTLERGEFLHLFSGGERDTYELCDGNIIRNVASSGAGSTAYQFFRLSGAELLKEVSIAYEADATGENWYLMGGFQYSLHRTLISEEEAEKIINSYKTISIEMIPFP